MLRRRLLHGISAVDTAWSSRARPANESALYLELPAPDRVLGAEAELRYQGLVGSTWAFSSRPGEGLGSRGGGGGGG